MSHYTKPDPPRLKPLSQDNEPDWVWNLFHPLSLVMFGAAVGYALIRIWVSLWPH